MPEILQSSDDGATAEAADSTAHSTEGKAAGSTAENTVENATGSAISNRKLAAAIEGFAGADRILIGLDFDGCLAPFVVDPMAARPLPESSRALAALAKDDGVTLALISGRPVSSLNTLASPPPGTWLIGSHGAEQARVDKRGEANIKPLTLNDSQASLLKQVTSAVEQLTRQYPGTRIEYKPASASLHTRGLDPELATQALDATLAGPGGFAGVTVIRGNQVVEIAVVDSSKGGSLNALRERIDREHAGEGQDRVKVLYAGDDITDETALATMVAGDIGIKVGQQETVAKFRVRDEEQMAHVLTALAAARSE